MSKAVIICKNNALRKRNTEKNIQFIFGHLKHTLFSNITQVLKEHEISSYIIQPGHMFWHVDGGFKCCWNCTNPQESVLFRPKNVGGIVMAGRTSKASHTSSRRRKEAVGQPGFTANISQNGQFIIHNVPLSQYDLSRMGQTLARSNGTAKKINKNSSQRSLLED